MTRGEIGQDMGDEASVPNYASFDAGVLDGLHSLEHHFNMIIPHFYNLIDQLDILEEKAKIILEESLKMRESLDKKSPKKARSRVAYNPTGVCRQGFKAHNISIHISAPMKVVIIGSQQRKRHQMFKKEKRACWVDEHSEDTRGAAKVEESFMFETAGSPPLPERFDMLELGSH